MLPGKTQQLNDERRCIYDVVAFHANYNPNAIAITAPDRTPLTYGEFIINFSRLRLGGKNRELQTML